MLSIVSELKRLVGAKGATASSKETSVLDQYEPEPLSRPRGAWTDEAAQDTPLFGKNEFQASERLESQTLSIIRGALYAAE